MSCKDLCPVLGEDAAEEHIVSLQLTQTCVHTFPCLHSFDWKFASTCMYKQHNAYYDVHVYVREYIVSTCTTWMPV